MWKKIIALIFVIILAVTGFFVYNRLNEDTYSINLEDALVIDGVSYKELDPFWVVEIDEDSDPIGRVQNDLTDFIITTNVHRAKNLEQNDFICTKNMFKTKIYKREDLEFPEFVRNNIEYVKLDNKRVKKVVNENEIIIEDANIIDYYYNLVKNTYNEPENKNLIKSEQTAFNESYALQFKLKGTDVMAEPSIVVELTDGDTCIYNKTAQYYNEEDKTYNTYLIDSEIVSKTLN